MSTSNLLPFQFNTLAVTLSNAGNTPTGDGAILTCDSTSEVGTIYAYSKTTPFSGSESENAAEIMLEGIGAQANFSNSITVTGQDPLTKHYAGWVQDSDGYGADMVLVFNMGAGETLTIPGGNGTYLYDVDHGDGQTSTGITTAGFSHTYTDARPEAVVRVSGAFPQVYFNNVADILKMRKILNWGDTSWSNAANAFYGAVNLVEASSEVSNTSSVTSMSSMMRNWTSMTSPPDLSSFDTSSVTTMSNMMNNWTSMESPPDLSSFDTSSVTSMSAMMYNWSSMESPPDLSLWNTSSVTSMGYMMQNWTAMGAVDIAIDTWNIGAVTNFTDFLSGSQLTTACYDRTLASWGNQTLAAGAASTTIHFGSSTYTDQASKDLLLAMVAGIIDGGVAP